MKTRKKNIFFALIAVAILFVAAVCVSSFQTFDRVSASAESAVIRVEKYEVNANVRSDRKVEFREKITVTFQADMSMFFRSLPVDGGDRYFDLWAKCEGNDDFYYKVKDNPDTDGFIDIDCYGQATRGKTWTYEIGYVMLPSAGGELDMSLDVIGFGWSVPLNNVDATITFPSEVKTVRVYSNGYGQAGNEYADWEYGEGNKSVSLHADSLSLRNGYAIGITLAFELADRGALESYSSTRVTGSVWIVVISGIAVLACSVFVFLRCRSPREIVSVVNLDAPRSLDPLQVGKLIDGVADDEDVTSMIYWFASRGYLTIDLTDEDDVLLKRTEKELPENEPKHRKVLLEGLFASDDEVRVSDLSEKFYRHADKAKTLLSAHSTRRYEKKSVVGVVCSVLLSVLFVIFVPMSIGFFVVGGGYVYFEGSIVLAAFLAAGAVLLRLRFDRRFKGGKSPIVWLFLLVLVAVLSLAVYCYCFDVHVISFAERLIVFAIGWLIVFVCAGSYSYTEEYAELLGEILGFKDFILHAESDRLEAMLKEMPELYYDILPYAQVLGVTETWTKKFKGLLKEPPRWATGDFTLLDYMVFRSLRTSLLARPQQRNGSYVGKFGGGGGFGGFAGGGHGGGGGGAR